MLKIYLKTALREISKNKIFSFIHIIGLSTGIAAFVLIIQYALYELSYDRFYENADQVYRIRQDRYDKGVLSTTWGAGCAAIGPAIKREFPEVLDYGILTSVKGIISIDNKAFREDRAFAANTSFLTMLPVNFFSGTDSTALNEPFTAVISESAARKFYGNTDALGKTFKLDNEVLFKVTGVFRDLPANTHIKFSILISWPTYLHFTGNRVETAWNWDGYFTYVRLAKGIDLPAFENKLNEFTAKQTEELSKQYNQSAKYYLQPFTSIHLHSHLMWEAEVNGNAETVIFLIVIAFIILIIAWVNYVNLSTIKSVFRSREIAIRKISGASRIQVIKQFISETFAVNFIASLLALIIVIIALPFFRSLTGREMNLNSPEVWLILLSVILFGPVFTGLYPAIVTSSFRPMNVFRGGSEGKSGGAYIRKGLIVFQFTASVILIAGTFTVYRQVRYMKAQELGVNIDKTLILRGPSVADSTYSKKVTAFKFELLKNSIIKSVTSSTCIPGNKVSWNAGGIRRLSDDDTKGNQYRILGVDYDFLDSYGLTVLAGRGFSREFGSDGQSVMFNEKAVKLMGFETPESALGESIYFWGQTYKIIGVLRNYHQESLKENYDALIFRFTPETRDYFSIRLNYEGESRTGFSELTSAAADFIKTNYEEFFPGNPFDFFTLSDHYNNQYNAEDQFMTIFELFAILAIIIACLGLFGLSWFVIARRTKEIGIRKVQGASSKEVVALVSGEFFRLVMLGIIIAAPLTYILSSKWMEKFAYQAGFSWWLFALSGILILIIAALAISYNVIIIARTNPAQSLREN
jgi:putative ABC transport system permease protein